MSRTFEVTDGSTTISLIDPDTIVADRGGLGPVSYKAQPFPGPGIAVVETYRLNMRAASHDAAAAQIQSLNALLTKADLYSDNPRGVLWQTAPVYIKAQTRGESGARYATIIENVEEVYPDFFDHPFELDSLLEGVKRTIVREHPWRDTPPGTLPSALTLAAADGPANPTVVHLANFWEETADLLTHVYHKDESAGTWSGNLVAETGDALFPAAPAAGDALYFGFDSSRAASHHIAIPIGTGADWDVTFEVQYWNGAAYTALTQGSEVTWWPTGTIYELFDRVGWLVINFSAPGTWATKAENGQTKFWLRAALTGVATFTSNPTLSDTDTIYVPQAPYFTIPAADLVGDAPPLLLFRFRSPAGGTTSPVMGTIQKVILGAKSRNLTNFRPNINLGNHGNTAAITVAAVDADSSFVAGARWPGGYRGRTTFSADPTEILRIRVTLDDLFDDYEGRYRLLLRAQQFGGTAGGQVKVRAIMRIGSTGSTYPRWFSELIPLAAVNTQLEVVELGEVAIPRVPRASGDTLTGTDIIFELNAMRTTGSAELYWGDLILVPIDEWSSEIADPLSDPTNGSSALRADTGLDVDSGVLRRRCVKNMLTSAGAVQPPAETWICKRFPNGLMPGRTYNIYVLMLHGPSAGFGSSPLLGTLGCHLSVQVYGHMRFHVLRGTAGV